MKIPNKVYDVLKWLSIIAFPALEALWLGLAGVWNLPYGTAVGATIALIGVFIGALIGVSAAKYNKEENQNDSTR